MKPSSRHESSAALLRVQVGGDGRLQAQDDEERGAADVSEPHPYSEMLEDPAASRLAAKNRARIACELVGTFTLALAVTLHTNPALFSDFQALSVSATVFVLIFVGAPMSGAHYNPALTTAFAVRHGKRHNRTARAYVCVQIIGAIAGAAVALALDGYASGLPGRPTDSAAWARVFFGEMLGTFFFALTVLYGAGAVRHSAATAGAGGGLLPMHSRCEGAALSAIALFAAIMSFKDISGGVVNPALSIGLYSIGRWSGHDADPVPTSAPLPASASASGRGVQSFALMLVYAGAELGGGALAGLVARCTSSSS